MNNIIVIQTRPGIGDLCIFLSSIHEIAKQNKNYKVYLLTKERTRAKNILQNDNFIFEIIYIDREKFISRHSGIFGFFNMVQDLKKYRFQKAYIMHYSLRYHLVCFLLNIRQIFSYGFFKKNENISKKIYDSTLKWLSIKKFNSNAKIKILDFKGNKKNIIIGIGSSGPTRRWGVKNFYNLIKKISTIDKFNFYIAAGKNEKNEFKQLKKKFNKDINIFSLCDHQIYDALKIIKGSKMYVGTDSAFMHLSAAVEVKSFGLFGDTPTNYGEYTNYIIPILPEGYQFIGHGSDAMNKISSNYVFSIIKKFLCK